MSNDSAFIPGIYNYCDRWCERCSFTGRCRVYATQQESQPGPGASDVRNAAFWDHMQGVLQQTRELILELARERGISLEEVQAAAAARPPRKKRPASPAHRDVLKQARSYYQKVEAWFEAHQRTLKRRGKDLISATKMGLKDGDPVGEANTIKDAVDVIRWYYLQIYVKLKRASGRDPEMDDPELAEVYQSDHDGSAKVALIGIDRSIAAWGRLYEQLPEAQDSVLDILVHLDRLRRATESLFPGARSFIRPGFDQPA